MKGSGSLTFACAKLGEPRCYAMQLLRACRAVQQLLAGVRALVRPSRQCVKSKDCGVTTDWSIRLTNFQGKGRHLSALGQIQLSNFRSTAWEPRLTWHWLILMLSLRSGSRWIGLSSSVL